MSDSKTLHAAKATTFFTLPFSTHDATAMADHLGIRREGECTERGLAWLAKDLSKKEGDPGPRRLWSARRKLLESPQISELSPTFVESLDTWHEGAVEPQPVFGGDMQLVDRKGNVVADKVTPAWIHVVITPGGEGIIAFELDWAGTGRLSIDDLVSRVYWGRYAQSEQAGGWRCRPVDPRSSDHALMTRSFEDAIAGVMPSAPGSVRKDHPAPSPERIERVRRHAASLGKTMWEFKYMERAIGLWEMAEWLLGCTGTRAVVRTEGSTDAEDRVVHEFRGSEIHHRSRYAVVYTVAEMAARPDDRVHRALWQLAHGFDSHYSPPRGDAADIGDMALRDGRLVSVTREGAASISFPDGNGAIWDGWYDRFIQVYRLLHLHVLFERNRLTDLSHEITGIYRKAKTASIASEADMERRLRCAITDTVTMTSDDIGGLSDYMAFSEATRRANRVPALLEEVREETTHLVTYLESLRASRDRKFQVFIAVAGLVALPITAAAAIHEILVSEVVNPAKWISIAFVVSAASLLLLVIAYSWKKSSKRGETS